MADLAETCAGELAAFSGIVTMLSQRTGTDFFRYRAATVQRRIRNRMISIGASNFAHYLRLLDGNEEETLRLLERVTIKVSRFYRNAPTFDSLRWDVLPALMKESHGRPLRVWSAGCGCGEEAYTLAMLLDEAGAEGCVEASDIDPSALRMAAAGRYPAASVTELPENLRNRYLKPEDDTFSIRDMLRERVRFARHDLTSGEPPPGDGTPFDLVCCRNVLIYFEREAQERAMREVKSAVRTGGFLCIGEAEWPLPSIAGTVESLGHKTRIFRALEHRLRGELSL